MAYFRPGGPGQRRSTRSPARGWTCPIWLLGSSDFSARLAAELGLPFAFASHFAPDYLHAALALYRRHFQPSEALDRAARDGRGERVRGRHRRRGPAAVHLAPAGVPEPGPRPTPGMLPPPVETMDGLWTPAERATSSG